MSWQVEFHDAFLPEFEALAVPVQDALLAHLIPLQEFGPMLGRPAVDTMKGSRIANLKELRFDADGGVWRVLFAFNGQRIAVLLAAGGWRQGRRGAGAVLSQARGKGREPLGARVMGKSLDDVMATLPADRQQRIRARGAEMIADEMTLRELRKAMGTTQAQLASKLGKPQATISRMEAQSDMLMSTLGQVVKGLGGRISIMAELPGHAPVRLSGLGDLATDAAPPGKTAPRKVNSAQAKAMRSGGDG